MGTLHASAESGDARRLYVSLRNDMARKLDEIESGRDYAAIAKSLVQVTEIIREMDENKAQSKEAKERAMRTYNKLAAQQQKFKVV